MLLTFIQPVFTQLYCIENILIYTIYQNEKYAISPLFDFKCFLFIVWYKILQIHTNKK
jgi:hypothetical protein